MKNIVCLSLVILFLFTGTISAQDIDPGELLDIGEKLTIDSLKAAAGEVSDNIDFLNKTQDAIDIIDRTVKQLGHVIHLDIIYEPEDGDNAIHLKEKADDENRRIKLVARLEYVWEGEPPEPEQGPVIYSNNIKDLPPREGIPVRWYLDSKHPLYMEVKNKDWEGAIPTFWNKTDNTGTAVGYFYPKLDQPLGGIRKVEEIEVEVVALIQAGLGITPWSLVDVAMGASEELFHPTSKTDKILIERHVPTPWEGKLNIHRSVKVFGITISEGPTSDNPHRTTKVSTSGLWDAYLTVDNIKLDTEGRGRGDYEFSVEGEGVYNETIEHLIRCDENVPPMVFTETIARSGRGRANEVGKLNLMLKVDPRFGKYAFIAQDTPLGQQAFSLLYSNSGKEIIEREDCDGKKRPIVNNYEYKPDQELRDSLLSLTDPYPLAEWPQFDLDSKVLNDSITYHSEHLSEDKRVGYEVTTHIDWNLKRVENSN